jgi:hypothetical protein
MVEKNLMVVLRKSFIIGRNKFVFCDLILMKLFFVNEFLGMNLSIKRTTEN